MEDYFHEAVSCMLLCGKHLDCEEHSSFEGALTIKPLQNGTINSQIKHTIDIFSA